MKKGAISNLKESWPHMNKVDPCSSNDHSHKNTRWIYVSAKFHMRYNKVLLILGNSKMNDDATVGPRSLIQTAQKVQILTMQIKEKKSNMEETV